MTNATKSLGQVTATGAVWLLAQNVSGRALGFLSQLVVAAILSPSDFGVIGLAYTVSTFGAILSNFGVESVLLQRQKTMRLWIVPAFWYSFGLGIIGFLIVIGVGPIAAQIYKLPEVSPLADIIAIGIPISSLCMVPSVVMRAEFRFKAIATINLLEAALIQGLTIMFALTGFGAYSFVLPLPIVALLRAILMWSITSMDMSGLFKKLGRIKYLMNSSLAVFGTGVIQSAISQGDYIVLGIFGNAPTVGVYFFAFKMASQPLLMMAMSLSNVLFPALSHLRNSPAAQNDAAIRAAKLLGLLIMPIAFLQCGLIEPAIHIFFPHKWDASIPLMQVLSVALGFDGIAWVASSLVSAQRGFTRQFLYVAAFAPPFFIMIVIGGWNGSALGVALAVAAYYVFVTPIYSYVAFRRGGMRVTTLLSLYVPPAVMAAAALGGAIGVADAVGVHQNIARIVIISIIMAALYTAILRVIDVEGYRDITLMLSKMLNRMPRAARLADN